MKDSVDLASAESSRVQAHTPGPWAVSKNTRLVFGAQQGLGLEPLGFIYGPSFEERSVVGRRAMADCVLCAAAPELLEALKYARRMVKALECDIAFIDAAIAKATGGQP